MARGRPDYTDVVEIKGNYSGTLTTLAVDTNGNLYAIMKGMFGSTLKDVAVDTDGNIIAILKGASGNNIAVDASGFISAVLKGENPSASLVNIKVDANGQMYAMLRALESGNPIDLISDGSGNLFLNIKAQDLSEVIQRNKYGTPGSFQSTVTVGASGTKSLLSVSGKGIIYRATFNFTGAISHATDVFRVKIEGSNFVDGVISGLRTYQGYGREMQQVYLIYYDETNFIYSVGFEVAYTFETSFEFQHINNAADEVTTDCLIHYATV